MSETKKVNILEVEVNKLSLKPGDVLLAKVSGIDFQDDEVCSALADSLRKVFPNNKVGVLFLQENQIDLSVISQETAQAVEKALSSEESSCNNANYCADCSCGKKQLAEQQPKEEENGPDSTTQS